MIQREVSRSVVFSKYVSRNEILAIIKLWNFKKITQEIFCLIDWLIYIYLSTATKFSCTDNHHIHKAYSWHLF